MSINCVCAHTVHYWRKWLFRIRLEPARNVEYIWLIKNSSPKKGHRVGGRGDKLDTRNNRDHGHATTTTQLKLLFRTIAYVHCTKEV